MNSPNFVSIVIIFYNLIPHFYVSSCSLRFAETCFHSNETFCFKKFHQSNFEELDHIVELLPDSQGNWPFQKPGKPQLGPGLDARGRLDSGGSLSTVPVQNSQNFETPVEPMQSERRKLRAVLLACRESEFKISWEPRVRFSRFFVPLLSEYYLCSCVLVIQEDTFLFSLFCVFVRFVIVLYYLKCPHFLCLKYWFVYAKYFKLSLKSRLFLQDTNKCWFP